jgi:radical SAM family RiPP maturation amino acid epimerase
MSLRTNLESKLASGSYPDFLLEVSDSELSIIAHAKRFVERYTADPEFRELAEQDCHKAASLYGIKIDPEEIRTLWDPEAGKKYLEGEVPLTTTLKLCQRYSEAMSGWMGRRRSCESLTHPNFQAWWQRQQARNSSELGMTVSSRDVYAPVCIELSEGCTVGCWFCAISAERFRGAFAYTPENRLLWHEALETIRDIIGPAAEVGFCYWATEPFDNPDYEEFIKDYHAIIGSMPSTTTAQAHKDISRARKLLQLWEDYGFTYNHWSLLTIKILDQIHNEFTAEELIWTKLCMLNKESIVKKANAGRALEKIKRLAARGEDAREILDELAQGTIACVSGFLINMVERKVQLISPCKASDQWPKGYKVYVEGTFSSGKDLRSIMEGMIAEYMPLEMPGDVKVRFRRGLNYRHIPDGFELATEFKSEKARNPVYGQMLGEMINSGSYTLDEILTEVVRLGVSKEDVAASIDAMFRNGLLDEELSQ